MKDYIIINPLDNVAVVLRPFQKENRSKALRCLRTSLRHIK